MALANYFYNQSIKRYITLFGSIFNKITIERVTDVNTQKMIVPISYGPYQKFLARLTQDPNLDRKQAISLPRMSFELLSMNYEPSRKLSALHKIPNITQTSSETTGFSYTPAPYTMQFNLYIMTKYVEDAAQIAEQILPFFKPDWTPSVKLIDTMDPFDVPITLEGINIEDIYEGQFTERRSIVWILSFSMKGYLFGPSKSTSVIKFVDIRYSANSQDILTNQVTVQPGLDSSGNPTNDINITIPYQDILKDDDWGIIQEFNDL